MQNLNKYIKRFAPLSVLILVMLAVYFSGLTQYFNLEYIQSNKDSLDMFVKSNPYISAALFIGLYTLSVALSLPIATVLTLLGGFLFGSIIGTFYVVTSATIGATIIFVIAQSALGESLRNKAKGIYGKVKTQFEEDGVSYLLFMRLVPLFPFVIVNILPALLGIKLRTFLWTTFFGIIPGSFVYVNLGGALGEITSLSGLVSGRTIGALVLLGVFALAPIALKKIKKKKA